MTTATPRRSQRDEHCRLTPLRRTGEVHEVANGVLFLASDEASFIVPTELVIGGGCISRQKLFSTPAAGKSSRAQDAVITQSQVNSTLPVVAPLKSS